MSALPSLLSLCRTVGPGTTLRKAAINRDRQDRRRDPFFTRFGLPPNRPVAAAGGGNHVAATHMAGYHRRCAQIWAIPGNAYPGTAELPSQLLEFHLGAGLLQLRLDLFRLVLGHAFLDGLGRCLDQVLGLLEAETGEGTDFLDHLDLLLASR